VGGARLDVDATLKNSSGTTLTASNSAAVRSATIRASGLSPGTYTLIIKGGAEGTPSNGFSNYSSLAHYGVEGTITGASASTGSGGTTGTTGGNQTTTGGASATGGTAGNPGTETCSCRQAGESSESGRGPVGLLALAATMLLRRRRAGKVAH
jgi:MYXO-CTERM domain-containing protein